MHSEPANIANRQKFRDHLTKIIITQPKHIRSILFNQKYLPQKSLLQIDKCAHYGLSHCSCHSVARVFLPSPDDYPLPAFLALTSLQYPSCPLEPEPCRLSDPPACKRDFLRLRRLLRVSVAFRRSLTSSCNNANWCITLDVPLLNWSIASKIDVGELP